MIPEGAWEEIQEFWREGIPKSAFCRVRGENVRVPLLGRDWTVDDGIRSEK